MKKLEYSLYIVFQKNKKDLRRNQKSSESFLL